MILTVNQKLDNGILAGPKEHVINLVRDSVDYKILINQGPHRTISISAEVAASYKQLLGVFYDVETLLMILGGKFIPVESVFENEVEVTHSWKKRTLPSYRSADFMMGNTTFLEHEKVITSDLLEKWNGLKIELDMIHNMYLYCMSSVEMPKDMQCAFAVELFLGICELVDKKRADYNLPQVPNGESKLKHYLVSLIDLYGKDIFAKETSVNKYGFAQTLVNSRNRIAHILSKQTRYHLNGAECVMYLKKLSLLYRVILLDLIGLPQALFKERLISIVEKIDEHETTQKYIEKLKDPNLEI